MKKWGKILNKVNACMLLFSLFYLIVLVTAHLLFSSVSSSRQLYNTL